MRYNKHMLRKGIGWICMIGGFSAFCLADTPVIESTLPDSPYKTIAERNAFGLKPPPPPVVAAPPVVEQAKSDLKLTGITSFGSVKAYFMATDPKSKAPEYFSLGVDEKKDGIEVLSIDDAGKSVRIRSAAGETLMSFVTHGVTPPTTPPASTPAPGAPGIPGASPGSSPMLGGVMNNMTVTPGTSPGSPSQGITTIPSRTLRGQTGQGLSTQYGFSGAPISNLPPQSEPRNKLSSEEQVILLEVQRMTDPSLPPTPGLPGTTPGGLGAPGGIPVTGPPSIGNPRLPRLPGQ